MVPARPDGNTQEQIEHRSAWQKGCELISLKVPIKTLKAITLEMGGPADAETGFTHHTVPKMISCAMSEDTVEVNPTHLPVSAWMNQHSSRDAVTEWICFMKTMQV